MSYEYWKPEVRHLLSVSLQCQLQGARASLEASRTCLLALLPEQWTIHKKNADALQIYFYKQDTMLHASAI